MFINRVSAGSIVSDCVYLDNTATTGGAISVAGSIRINNTEFNNNKATYFGGALFFQCLEKEC